MRYRIFLLILFFFFALLFALGKTLVKGNNFSAKVLAKNSFQSIQSMAIYNNYIVSLTKRGTAYIYDYSTHKKLATIDFKWDADSIPPHANVTCFGTEFAPGNKDFPLLYSSTWYYNSQRACYVYNLKKENDKFSMELVQTIYPDELNQELFGPGCVDWVVDTDKSMLYALTYKVPGNSRIVEGNAEIITKFRLPKLSDGREVHLQDSQILDNYTLEMFNYSQDKVYHKGHIYIASGNIDYPHWMLIRDLDLKKKKLVSKVNIKEYIPAEPEGLDIVNGKLNLLTGGKDRTLYQLNFQK